MVSAQPVDFDDYVVRNRRALKRFATVLSGQTWLADDLVADVLGRAFERWDRIGVVADPHAYVRRMIVNDYLSWGRRLARVTPRAEIQTPESVSDRAQEHAERDAMITRLAALICADLPNAARSAGPDTNKGRRRAPPADRAVQQLN